MWMEQLNNIVEKSDILTNDAINALIDPDCNSDDIAHLMQILYTRVKNGDVIKLEKGDAAIDAKLLNEFIRENLSDEVVQKINELIQEGK